MNFGLRRKEVLVWQRNTARSTAWSWNFLTSWCSFLVHAGWICRICGTSGCRIFGDEGGLDPAGTDQVVVGDMERSRLKDVKVLFFAGVNEGSVPREKSRGGLLSEMDRERLAEQEVELAPTSRQETCIQKFYMYLSLTKPSQRLILSWSLADADGKSLRPSWLIASIKELFPEVDIRTEADRTLTGLLALPEGSLTELTEAVQAAREQKETRLQQALIRWYAEHKEWQQKLDRLLDAVFYVKEQPIGHAVARARRKCFWKEALPGWNSLQPAPMRIFYSMVSGSESGN